MKDFDHILNWKLLGGSRDFSRVSHIEGDRIKVR